MTSELNNSTKALLVFVLIVHIMFFVLEAILWMHPEVHTLLIALLNNPVSIDVHTQALTLKNLFINQGFYNLFLVVAGVAGLQLVKRQQYSAGYALLLLLCFSATGAGIILALSTKAYLLAFFQAVPAAVAFIKLYPLYKRHSKAIVN
jgi:putative membrane protein